MYAPSSERVRHSYSPDEDDRILELMLGAVNQGLDQGVVALALADEFGTTPKAIKQHYSKLRQARGITGRGGVSTSLNRPSSLFEDLNRFKGEFERVVSRLESVVEERDEYKEKYENLLRKHRKIAHLLAEDEN